MITTIAIYSTPYRCKYIEWNHVVILNLGQELIVDGCACTVTGSDIYINDNQIESIYITCETEDYDRNSAE